MFDVVAIGQRIRSRREQMGLTLDDVAARVGITKATVSRYENGIITRLKIPVLESIARALDLEPEDLLDPTRPIPSYSRPVITEDQLRAYLDTLTDTELLDLLQRLIAKMQERGNIG